MPLPVERSKPSKTLWDYTIYLYGIPKVGKSTLVAEIEDVLFFNTGGGLSAIECYQQPINTWEEFLSYGAEFLTTEHKFNVLAIDTIERLHKLCVNYIMTRQKVTHPQDLEFGKGYDMVKDEFIRPLTRLALSKYGLILIGHVKEIEVTGRIRKLSKSIPSLQDYVWQLIDGLTDICMFYTTVDDPSGKKRVIKTDPSEEYIAGDRTNRLRTFGDIVMSAGGENWKRIEEVFNQSTGGK